MKKLQPHQVNAEAALSAAVRGIINLPTGTGKTLIQSRAIVNHIQHNEPKVYVIASPRILLSNQLMSDVRADLAHNGVSAQYLVVHSGRPDDRKDIELEHDLGISFRETLSGTKVETIAEAYRRATAEKVSLVVSSTYHSIGRIVKANIPVEILFCDEAHYLVQEQFSWIVATPFPAKRAYYFTATLRETPSKEGMGMNNSALFGNVLYRELPVDMIAAGQMVRPRMHLVDMSHAPQKDEADGLAVAEAFVEHRSLLNGIGAKMLVVAKDGSDHLNSLAQHPLVADLIESRPSFRVFDISSAFGARINGIEVTRSKFLEELRSMKDHDEAIIIHHDILAEGIDVAGITGVMPLISLGKAKFLQTLGRSTRLHDNDRSRLYAGKMTANELRRFTKPYAWLIVPVYGEIGEDMHEDMAKMIRELRTYGFNPSEDVVIRQKRGKKVPEPIASVTDKATLNTAILEFVAEVVHTIEDEKKAEELEQRRKEHFESTLHLFVDFADDEQYNNVTEATYPFPDRPFESLFDVSKND